jgi:hypothetical protein
VYYTFTLLKSTAPILGGGIAKSHPTALPWSTWRFFAVTPTVVRRNAAQYGARMKQGHRAIFAMTAALVALVLSRSAHADLPRPQSDVPAYEPPFKYGIQVENLTAFPGFIVFATPDAVAKMTEVAEKTPVLAFGARDSEQHRNLISMPRDEYMAWRQSLPGGLSHDPGGQEISDLMVNNRKAAFCFIDGQSPQTPGHEQGTFYDVRRSAHAGDLFRYRVATIADHKCTLVPLDPPGAPSSLRCAGCVVGAAHIGSAAFALLGLVAMLVLRRVTSKRRSRERAG